MAASLLLKALRKLVSALELIWSSPVTTIPKAMLTLSALCEQ